MGPASNDKDSYSLAIMSVGAALVVLFAGAAVIAAVGHQVPKELWGAASTLSGALVGILVPSPKTKADAAGSAPVAAAAITHAAAVTAARGRAAHYRQEHASPAVQQAADAAADAVENLGGKVAKAAIGASVSRLAAAGVVDAAIKVQATDLEKTRQGLVSAQAAVQAAGAGGGAAAAQAATGQDAAQARVEVHQAAVDGANDARQQAADVARTSATISSVSIIRESLKVVLPLFVFLVALGFGLAIAGGAIHPAGCPLTNATGNTVPACDTSLIQTSNELIALAAAAGGALVGLFANAPAPKAGTAT